MKKTADGVTIEINFKDKKLIREEVKIHEVKVF